MVDLKSVINLRDLAQEHSGKSENFQMPGLNLPFDDDRTGIDIFVPVAEGEGETGARNVFLFVLQGSIVLNDQTFAAGEGCILTAGLKFSWSASDETKLVRMAVDSGSAAVPQVIRIDTDAPLSPSSPPPAEYLTGAVPECRSNNVWRSPDGQFYCGMWASTPYYRRPVVYAHYEFMYLCEGSVTFVSEDGEQASFHAGDAFLIGKGAVWAWDSQCDVRKMYAIFRPA